MLFRDVGNQFELSLTAWSSPSSISYNTLSILVGIFVEFAPFLQRELLCINIIISVVVIQNYVVRVAVKAGHVFRRIFNL
jgi:uncharacterized membrane protein HdeD (DUF308 family)